MICAEHHTIANMPGGVYVLLCGTTTAARIEMKPGTSRDAVQQWVALAIKTHIERRPRSCQRSTNEGDWCFGESHTECQ